MLQLCATLLIVVSEGNVKHIWFLYGEYYLINLWLFILYIFHIVIAFWLLWY